MPAELTEKEFAKHLNTTFHIDLGAEAQVELELIEVKSYASSPGDQTGMERFSLFFRGPSTPILPQRLYSFTHDQMGNLDIFIVPIEPDTDGARYEAVFNYFKNK